MAIIWWCVKQKQKSKPEADPFDSFESKNRIKKVGFSDQLITRNSWRRGLNHSLPWLLLHGNLYPFFFSSECFFI